MFARIDNNAVVEFPLNEWEIRARFPDSSFPANLSDNLPDGYVRVAPGSEPSVQPWQKAVESTPVLSGGQWQQSWTVVDVQSEADYLAEKRKQKITDLTAQRDLALRESDWVALRHRDQVDAQQPTTLTQAEYLAWLTYRQSLRDFMSTVVNPDTAVLPQPPGQLGVTNG